MPMPHLLDQLADREGCDCLSDLRQRPSLYFTLMELPASAFPEEMWRETLLYLAMVELPSGTAEECRDQLLAFYQKKCGKFPQSGAPPWAALDGTAESKKPPHP